MRIRIREFISAYRRFQNYGSIIGQLAKNIRPTHLILKNGIQIYGQENSQVLDLTYEIFFDKIYSPDNLSIEDNDIVVDIGAHQGVFSLLAASLSRNTIHAFEPLPANCNIIKKNIEINGFNNIKVHEMAISDNVGSLRLAIDGQMGSFFNIRPGREHLDVPTTTLKQIMLDNKIEQIGFLKMDCEGLEGLILKSTTVEYLKRIKKIAMEFHEQSILSYSEIHKLLEGAGFIVDDSKFDSNLLYAKQR